MSEKKIVSEYKNILLRASTIKPTKPPLTPQERRLQLRNAKPDVLKFD